MIDPLAWDQVAEIVRPEDFYRPDHQLIFATIARRARAGNGHDPVLVFAELGESATAAGGFAYLSEIARNTPTACNIAHYAEIVAERARLRRLQDLGTTIESAIADGFGSEQIALSLRSVLERLPARDHSQKVELLATTSAELMAPIEAETFLLPGVPVEAYTLFAGALSSFKTTLLIYLLVWKATGWDVVGFDERGPGCEIGKAVLLTYEDTDSRMISKMRRIIQHGHREITRRYSRDDADTFVERAAANLRRRVLTGNSGCGLVHRVAGSIVPNEAFISGLIKGTRAFAPDGVLVGLDPLRLATVGSQNDDDGADTVVHVLNRIATEIPRAAIIACSHTNKTTAQDPAGGYTGAAYATSGSALYSQHARSNFLLTRLKDSEIRQLFDPNTVTALEAERQMVVKLTHGRLSHGAEEAERYFVMRDGTLTRVAPRTAQTPKDLIQSAGIAVMVAIDRIKTSGVRVSKKALEADSVLLRAAGGRDAVRSAFTLLQENGHIEGSGSTKDKDYTITPHGRALMQSGESRRETPEGAPS